MFAIFSSILLAVSAVSALQYSPAITSPAAGDVWYKGDGQMAKVTWNKTQVPADLVDHYRGTFVKLGYLEGKDTNEHLTFDLANNFRLGDGEVAFALPASVFTCTRCIIAIGDSGNISPEFEIRSA